MGLVSIKNRYVGTCSSESTPPISLSLFSFPLQHSSLSQSNNTNTERGEFNFQQWRFLLLQQNGSSSCFWRCSFEKKPWPWLLPHRSLTSGLNTHTNSVSVSEPFVSLRSIVWWFFSNQTNVCFLLSL